MLDHHKREANTICYLLAFNIAVNKHHFWSIAIPRMNRYLGHEGKVQGQIQDYRKGGWGGGLGNCKVLKCIAFTCMHKSSFSLKFGSLILMILW